jgi:hypothetical protein
MSSRAVRRALVQKGVMPAADARPSASAEQVLVPAPVGSAFAALDSDDDPDPQAEEQQQQDLPGRAPRSQAAPAPPAKSKSKSKRKKSGNKKAPGADQEDLDLDLLLAGMMSAAPAPPSSKPSAAAAASLLGFPPTHLNPDEEVRRKLGVRAPTAASGRKASRTPYYLSSPDPDWPPPPTFATRLGAHMLVDEHGAFTFEAGQGYRAAQQHFVALQATYDPQMIVQLLQQYPYHVDALLQMYDVLVGSQQNEAAFAMLRKALFALESWASPAFRKALGTGAYPARALMRTDAH